MLNYLLRELKGYDKTCPIDKVESGCTVFARNDHFLKYLQNTDKRVAVLVPKGLDHSSLPDNIKVVPVEDEVYAFFLFHNHVNKNTRPKKNIIGKRCRIHPSATIGVEGITFANAPNGEKIQLIHTGDVVIGNDVDIGAQSIIHRGSMGSTVIEDGVKIGVMVNIGHNNVIGKNTIVVGGTITSGSVKIGKQCWVCAGSLIRNGVSICDEVVVGMGSMVLKNITESGMYWGWPAVRQGDYDPNFNL